MDGLITQTVKKLKFTLPFLYVYVDDTLLAAPKHRIGKLVEVFNQYHQSLQFTLQMEDNQSIPFLACTVIRNQDGTLYTHWDQKLTDFGRMLNFYSSHHMNHKKSVIHNLILRIVPSTHEKFYQQHLNRLRNIWLANNYPTNLMDHCIVNYNCKKEK